MRNVVADISEQDADKKAGRNQKCRADGQRKEQGDVKQLLCRAARVRRILPAQILRTNNRAARAERRENADDEVVERVHKRDAGNRRFANLGNHHRGGHADGHGEQLLQHQRNHEPPERGGGEHRPLNGRGIFHTVWVSRLLQRFRAYFSRTRHKLTERRRFSRFTGALAAS
ncbi:hypothetical protein SDC9_125422 [bioreactor metagenome]|uniref:Uncharacterized protein n=1 Tax=bioreactor metagenome TaxID=1076179 RepID=A0A645CN98_9ZZZZ